MESPGQKLAAGSTDSLVKSIRIDGQVAILQIADQRFPPPQTVVDRFRRGGPVWDLAALSHQPFPEDFRSRFRALLAQLPATVGIQFLLPRLTLDVVQGAEESQAFLRDLAAMIGVQIMELAPGMRHTTHFDHTPLEERLVAHVIITDELSGPGA
jgi:hypothetical protein